MNNQAPLATKGYRKLPRISFTCPACGHHASYALKLREKGDLFVCEKCQARARLKHSLWVLFLYCSLVPGIAGGFVYLIYRQWFLWAPVIAPLALTGLLSFVLVWLSLPAFSRRFYLWVRA